MQQCNNGPPAVSRKKKKVFLGLFNIFARTGQQEFSQQTYKHHVVMF